ncbi:hypothetical protein [uncultured Methanolobus sp.]|uniref:hypothetical protein n=1 Tax=uncultured Methanolobus sp. TaxID=218300 RepID=UPI0029C8EEF6|nr:hypothetical protein [uncultured Methanolobus sp.]
MGVKVTSFLRDTRGVDTIPLKMVFYLTVTGAIIVLVAASWNSLSPVYSGAKDSKQINAAALELLSIQNGYARNIQERIARKDLHVPLNFLCQISTIWHLVWTRILI